MRSEQLGLEAARAHGARPAHEARLRPAGHGLMTSRRHSWVRKRTRALALLLAVLVGALTSALAMGWPSTSQPAGPPPAFKRSVAVPAPVVAAPPKTGTSCASVIAGLSPHQRLAQLLMVGVSGNDVAQALDLVRNVQVGGIFLNGNGTALLSGGQLLAMATAPIPPMVSVDEEGGRVQRVNRIDGSIPSARVMAHTMTPEQVNTLAGTRGAALRARGVTVDFAPDADVTDQSDDDVIGDRSYGADPLTVTRYARAFAAGLRASGVLPVVKHFPGHGHASGDSHRSSVITPPLAELTSTDLVPFDVLLTTPPVAVMVGHLEVPGLTDGLPASLSPATYRLLHGPVAFPGMAITDDLGSMRAVTSHYPLADAVLTALTAGADMAMWSAGGHVTDVLDTLTHAVDDGRLPTARITDALDKVLRAKSVCTP